MRNPTVLAIAALCLVAAALSCLLVSLALPRRIDCRPITIGHALNLGGC